MGEVYRARNTRLDRDVAIKVLPAAFTRDAAAQPADRSGLIKLGRIRFTQYGAMASYSTSRAVASDLYVVEKPELEETR